MRYIERVDGSTGPIKVSAPYGEKEQLANDRCALGASYELLL